MKDVVRNCAIFLGVLLTGCATEIRYVEVPVLPEDAWIVDCLIEPPPSVLLSKQAAEDKRLIMMTSAYNNQTSNIRDCNNRWKSLREWKSKQIMLRETNTNKE